LARLVVVSNRVAVLSRHGASRAGGLAVAIRPVLKRHPGIWFGWSGRVAAASDVTVRTSQHGHQTYVLIDLAEDDYQEYYNGYANRVLWPILHYRLDLAEFSRRRRCFFGPFDGCFSRVDQHNIKGALACRNGLAARQAKGFALDQRVFAPLDVAVGRAR
jgi:Glycosyltransferase family 20